MSLVQILRTSPLLLRKDQAVSSIVCVGEAKGIRVPVIIPETKEKNQVSRDLGIQT